MSDKLYDFKIEPDEQLFEQGFCSFCGLKRFVRLIFINFICRQCEREKRSWPN